jgi:hypothetical protein
MTIHTLRTPIINLDGSDFRQAAVAQREAGRAEYRARRDAVVAAETGFREIVRETYSGADVEGDIQTLQEMADRIRSFADCMARLHGRLDTARTVTNGHRCQAAKLDTFWLIESIREALPLSPEAASVLGANVEAGL